MKQIRYTSSVGMWLLIVSIVVFSCQRDNPANEKGESSGTFPLSQARHFFEANAPDLQLAKLLYQIPETKQATDYYSGKSEITGNGYIYTVDMHPTYFVLQNKDNIKFQIPQYNTDGVTPTDLRMANQAIDLNNEDIYKLFRQVFSQKEIQEFKLNIHTEFIEISHVISMRGDVLEVLFYIPNIEIYKNIHPDKFYQLEQTIKKQLKFFVSPAEKRVSYIKGKKRIIYIDKL